MEENCGKATHFIFLILINSYHTMQWVKMGNGGINLTKCKWSSGWDKGSGHLQFSSLASNARP